jgi:HPt (histidine-containing phosphotransfer) domain-containing protein
VSERELVYDANAIASKCDGDVDFIRHLVHLYLTEYPQQADVLRRASDSEDLERLYSVSHSIKGAISQFGARRGVEAAQSIEASCRLGDVDAGKRHAEALIAALDELAQALRADYGSP